MVREIRIALPGWSWPRNLTGNLIGVVGLAAVAFFAGALLNNFEWSGLLGGLFAVALAVANGRAAGELAPAKPMLKPVTAAVSKAG